MSQAEEKLATDEHEWTRMMRFGVIFKIVSGN